MFYSLALCKKRRGVPVCASSDRLAWLLPFTFTLLTFCVTNIPCSFVLFFYSLQQVVVVVAIVEVNHHGWLYVHWFCAFYDRYGYSLWSASCLFDLLLGHAWRRVAQSARYVICNFYVFWLVRPPSFTPNHSTLLRLLKRTRAHNAHTYLFVNLEQHWFPCKTAVRVWSQNVPSTSPIFFVSFSFVCCSSAHLRVFPTTTSTPRHWFTHLIICRKDKMTNLIYSCH